MDQELDHEKTVIVIFAILLGILRICGMTSPIFQAAAHLFVGGLIGVYIYGKEKFYLWLAALLTILETLMFAGHLIFSKIG